MALHWRIFTGAVLGAGLGALAYAALGADSGTLRGLLAIAKPVGDVFIGLLFMLVLPLLFSALALGVAQMQDMRTLGRMGGVSLLYTGAASVVAVAVGMLAVELFQPGAGVAAEQREQLLRLSSGAWQAPAAAPRTGIELLTGIVPRNPIKAAADGDYLGWMFFSLMIGVGLALVRTEGTKRLEEALQGLFDVCMRLIQMVIALAPIGVFALLFALTATLGWGILVQIGKYMLVVTGALCLHQFVVYGLAVKYLGGMSPRFFFRGSAEAMLTAFSTSSSNATLPTALRVAEEKLRLPQHVSRFVLTIGATANQNGTALFATAAVLFLAQFYGADLRLGQMLTVGGVCVLAGIGTAGVPSGSMPILAMLLNLLGLPVEGVGLIFAVDRFLDMCRTTLNVTGDLTAAVIVARVERAVAARDAGIAR
jgi:DAACS family dicarboxylate/amino acid:cation (Na+ or H+) symporter